jgi:hypothetical protein
MWLKPGARPRRFTAVEEFAVETVAFSWRARFPILPLVSMRVVDRYIAGEGVLEARVFGVPLMRRRGPHMAEGEAMRYLAELPWVPHALLANGELDWREVGAQTLEVGAHVGSARVAVRLEFDAAGDIVASYGDRPRLENKHETVRPFRGTFSDYEVMGGIRMPTRGEVRWDLPDGPFTYWRGAITSVELSQA